MDNPITAHPSAAATIHPVHLLDSHGQTLRRRACSALVMEAGESGAEGGVGGGEGGGAPPALPEPPATEGPGPALDVGSAGSSSSGPVGS
jgi:hypothetical protein